MFKRDHSFLIPLQVFIDARTGHVSTRTTGKDGKGEFSTPILNCRSTSPMAWFPLSLKTWAGPTQKQSPWSSPRPGPLVQLVISKIGEDNYSLVGFTRKATHYEIKIELGGIAGVVAPLIGKAPPNIEIWAVTGEAPTFVGTRPPLC